MVEEPESAALTRYLDDTSPILATSRLALVEVTRAVGVATASAAARNDAIRVVESCLLVEVTAELVRAALELASLHVRTLDAIQLASALRVGADAILVYDSRLADAALAAGLVVERPNQTGSDAV